MDLVVFCLFTKDVGIRRTELLLVESIPETLAALRHFLLYLLFDLSEIVFYEIVRAIALLGILVVYQGVVESGDMARSDPGLRVHEHAGVDTYHILVEAGHCLPPVTLDVVL